MSPDGSRRADLVALALVLVGVLVLYWTAPKGGAFYWSDAPRHALNGVFVKDLVAAMPWRDPASFAYAYYAKYPALTILFYPPLFYVLSAPLYALLGVSHESALWAVMLHYGAFGWGCYRLARFWVVPVAAAAFALTMMFLPEIAFWGRQVMLEVPAYAFAVWSAVFFLGHLREHRQRDLVWAAALLTLGMYTKITVAFLAVAYGIALIHQRRMALLRDHRFWLTLAGTLAALVPLVVLTMKFGQANLQSVTGVDDRIVSRATLSGWIWYARQWPLQLGWPLLVMVVAAFFVSLLPPSRSGGLPASERCFLVAWFAIGYVFFSAIDLKEARHSVYILLPLVLCAFLLVGRRVGGAARSAAVAALALASIGWTLLERPVYYVDGYATAAKVVSGMAPRDSMVLFSGYRDGSFTFNMRTLEDRSDLSVLRADKMLLRVAVRRELGVEQKPLSDEEILATLNRNAVHYLVVQPGFWNDLEVMRRFEALLRGDQFAEVTRIATPANHKAQETELVIYRNLGAPASGPGGRQIELPMIGRTINVPPTGNAGGRTEGH